MTQPTGEEPTGQTPGKAESQREVPAVLTEAEGVKFWTEMDAEHFADFLLQDLKAVAVAEKEYQIADFCSRELLMKIWDGSTKSIQEWQEMEDLKAKPLVYWMSVSTVSGIIYGRTQPS